MFELKDSNFDRKIDSWIISMEPIANGRCKKAIDQDFDGSIDEIKADIYVRKYE
ncbi:MAG: hypothetical protein AB1756_02490 [Acidobacteriota bacterium]